jgi:urease accessory protein
MRAVSIQRGRGNGPAPIDTVVLDAQARNIRRKLLVCRSGGEVLVDLPKPVILAHGDCLVLQDGRMIEVVAEAEDLTEVRARDPAHLLRLAWHIGNRHLPAQIEAGRIAIQRDRVIADMLRGLGAEVRDVREPFHPEHGAYHGHGH